MSLRSNLVHAGKAVASVNGFLHLGSSTRQSFLGRARNPTTQMCIVSQREMQRYCAQSQLMFQPGSARNSVEIECAARMAKVYGCGNCGDMAALAYTLLQQWGVKPLDLMKCTNMDHMFVVIGMRDGADPTDYRSWGPEAVVCDPWAPGVLGGQKGRHYAASEIAATMVGGQTTRYTSVQRFPQPGSHRL